MTDRPNIHQHVAAICADLGLTDPSMVRKLVITPTLVQAEVYKPDTKGRKYVDPATGDAAIEHQTFKVTA